jgi:hypothetical protein
MWILISDRNLGTLILDVYIQYLIKRDKIARFVALAMVEMKIQDF